MDAAPERMQRIDQWLWMARFFKTRTKATKFVSDGNVRITRNEHTARAEKASSGVKPGDTLTFPIGENVRIIEIKLFADRRGPASEAATLYEDHSPPPLPKPEKKPAPFSREAGSGRPTKKDARALSALKARS